MTTTSQARTTIGQLVYAQLPAFSFEKLMADLDTALSVGRMGERTLAWAGEEAAQIDVGSARIMLALARGAEPSRSGVVTIAVGCGPDGDADQRHAQRRAVLARLIADRITARHPPRETLWSTSDSAPTLELIASSTAEMSVLSSTRRQMKAERASAQRATPRHFVGPDDLPRMLAQVESTLAQRREAGDDALPAPQRKGLPLFRSVRRGASAGRPGRLAPVRLAVHLVNAALMLVVVPTGTTTNGTPATRSANVTTTTRN
ncbi:hypothetical protein [Rubellimicrobium arenae]|uniref:hypothetical protein n=1 Tax=Rubellimicrobium arenae TaxID=2817372 RepID=UPI001B308B90|nr:hypothetical protein [Rubellimicrobium arenae]